MASRPAGTVLAETFASPMRHRGPLPLRVAVYGEIAAAVRAGTLQPGDLLPPEADLGRAFQVSRTVMREALIMLEEDGLIRTQRGVGRFVVDVLPEVGLEQLRPVETMLSLPEGRSHIRRLRAESEVATDFTRRGLGLADDQSALMWESVVTHDDGVVCLSQEWVAAHGPAPALVGGLARLLDPAAADDRSLLALLLSAAPGELGPALCHVSVSKAGADRAHMLGVKASSPVLLLSQTVGRDGAPLYVAKHLIRPEVGHLAIVQT